MFDIETGMLINEIPPINPVIRGESGIRAFFISDGKTLVVQQGSEGTTYLFNVGTWDIRFDVAGEMSFNNDDSLLIVKQDDYGPVQLIEVASGKVLSQLYGNMVFIGDNDLVRQSELVAPGIERVQLVEATTGRVVIVQDGLRAVVPIFENGTLLEFFDYQMRNTHYVDLSRNVTIHVRGNANLYTAERNFLLIHPEFVGAPQRLIEFASGNTYILDFRIELADFGSSVFASNGLLVDIYGPPSARLDTMSAPRPDGGVASTVAGDVWVYLAPNSSQLISQDVLATTEYFYVIGQNPERNWLYVTSYNLSSPEVIPVVGWIRAENLEVIEPWDDAPVLDPADPLRSLRAIAEERAP